MDSIKKVAQLFNSYITVEVVTVLFCYTLPLLQFGTQDLLYSKICVELIQNETKCGDRHFLRSHQMIESETSLWTIYCNLALVLPSIFSAVIQGGYVDKYGIQLPLTIPLVGTALGFILIAIIAWTPAHHAYILIAMLVLGFTGHASSIIMAFMAFITKDSGAEMRSIRIAVVASSLSLAVTMGVGTFGPILDHLGISWLFIIGAISATLGLFDVMFRLRRPELQLVETECETHSLRTRLCNIVSLESVRNYIRILSKKREKHLRLYMHLMVTTFVLSFCALIGVVDVEFLYLTKEKNFTSTEVSVYMAVGSLLTFTGNILAVYILNIKLGLNILYTSIIGSISSALCYGGLSLSSSRLAFWVTNIFRLLSGLISVGARTFISSCADTSEQGVIMSFIAVVEACFKLVASAVFNGLYSTTLATWPGMVLMLAAVFCLLGAGIIIVIIVHRRRRVVEHQRLEEDSDPFTPNRRESILPVDEALVM